MKRFAIVVLALAFFAVLANAMLGLGSAAVDLRPAVAGHLPDSGVGHPVTAVLLNYRGYDTLLEVAVLLVALLAIVAAVGAPEVAAATRPRAEHPVLQTLARLAAPLAALVAVYLLWAGAFRPGGAFQAGAVLAAAAVLLHLAGLLRGWNEPGLWLRVGLGAGFLVFLVVAAGLSSQGAMLEYPPDAAGALILLIESGLTLSLGFILAGLFLLLSREGRS
jgi:multisubunit Na+/H+ antiporter MnhB subunit